MKNKINIFLSEGKGTGPRDDSKENSAKMIKEGLVNCAVAVDGNALRISLPQYGFGHPA